MKRKSQQQAERRRALVEMNLLDDGRVQAIRRKGCLGLFGSLLALAAVFSIVLVMAAAIR